MIDAGIIGYLYSHRFIFFVGGDAMHLLRASQSGVSLQVSATAVILISLPGDLVWLFARK